ncbi:MULTISPECIES: YwdI family protein [unclassified Staphylococcus]|uniref:YwdI family protein n=1 Tax=unclassified Staphylococcus TaxID=91994 RepID=UPI0021D3E415|nr:MULTISPECIES: YwdI family protein [unclassified Staphylococcus]UXR78611.1 YwdI family protein [Staphylococcus sp. IVB6227]UXR82769.1 YwdI family protein [Staphylococcus sp. IVB6214]
MQREKLIQLLEHELMQADQATTDAAFDKHMYAIHTLTALYTDQVTPNTSIPTTTHMPVTSTKVSEEEIRLMGGRVTESSVTPKTTDNRLVTDDEIGNGESIFDF